MCKAFDELIEEERMEGERTGIIKGKKEEKFMIIKRMYKNGMEEKLIREMTRCTRKEFAAAISE